ncbi:tyrosine-type recombinase/integrase [Dyadobacter subterraneus]|uniref:Tyrosine-type recombinase/integrase n=1 Tax=Dyadobacter subterraneus TaxID=2773304 RepID=A0ABR9W7B3_9BACT|nr:tyrosine-type recombinase/integrase [Dyadobacter subterraneus]MBE9461313.1 tyrosine-type recombinase/integrase [Dyadobacter subterraneus]
MHNHFTGIYAPYLDQYLDYKRQLGFKQQTEESILAVFDRFTVSRGETRLGITPELSQAWMQTGANLSSSYNFHRALLINKLASFLNEQGIHSYLMRLPVCKMDFTPHIYSQDELGRLFEAADHFRIRKGLRQIMFAMPALLRLLYCTGLRGGEALALSVGDVNLDDRTILVRDSKNGQQRVIPFSDSLAAVLRQYAFYRNELPACLVKKDLFFISLDGKRISHHCFGRWFSRLLLAAGIPKGRGITPHALRHSFSVHSLAMMAERGADIYCCLPVLSTYLGHKSVESTNHYVRLVSAMYPGLLKDIDRICINVFPNSSGYETY